LHQKKVCFNHLYRVVTQLFKLTAVSKGTGSNS